MSETSKIPPEQMFNSNANCIADWCLKTRASEEGNTYNETYDKFCYKKIQSAVQYPEEDYFHVSNIKSSKRVTAY